MAIKKKIGLIGVGNMGTAILEGLLEKGLVRTKDLWVYDKILEKAQAFSKTKGVHLAASNLVIAEQADVILLAVKPQDLRQTADEFQSGLKASHLIITILAGTPIAKMRSVVGNLPKIVRAMPNLGAKVGEAVTALSGENSESLSIAEAIFSGCGKTLQLDESHFDLVTAVSGSGPAYFFYMMELLAVSGTRQGLSQEQAQTLAVQTALGAALLASSSKDSPEVLRKKVTSKGGTTEAALNVLNQRKFPEIFSEAIEAALQRGRQLSQD